MSLNEYNDERATRLLALITAFDGSLSQLDGVQAELQGAVGLFENDGSGVSELVRLAEADVEEIRFTRLLDEQGAAVAMRTAQLVAELEGLMG